MITNIAGYQFVSLKNLEKLRDELKSVCKPQGLLGTILLSKEGINLMLAGTDAAIKTFTQILEAKPEFKAIEFKISYSKTIPFEKCLVKIKPELIPAGFSPLQANIQVAKPIEPEQFKQLLDQKADITVLDTRNHFEVEIGAFTNAIDPQIENFRSFKAAVKKLNPALKQKPVVIYCTGGIRCEKAGYFLIEQGFADVYQLNGGILNYFERCGNAHFNGDCFVFDERVAVNSELKPI